MFDYERDKKRIKYYNAIVYKNISDNHDRGLAVHIKDNYIILLL